MTIYVSFDLETGGQMADSAPILSVGACAVDSDDMSILGEFSHNLKIPENRVWEPDYKQWWDEQPRAIFEANRTNPGDPWWVMSSMLDWIEYMGTRAKTDEKVPVFVANPIAFDLPILRSYMMQFVKERWMLNGQTNKNTLSGVDLPTLAMAILNNDYQHSSRSKWPKEWTPDHLPLTHIAIDDARLQTHAFITMMGLLGDR